MAMVSGKELDALIEGILNEQQYISDGILNSIGEKLIAYLKNELAVSIEHIVGYEGSDQVAANIFDKEFEFELKRKINRGINRYYAARKGYGD